jgi:hypothetical protein
MTGTLGSDRHNAELPVRCPSVRGTFASVAVVGLLIAGCGSSGHKSASAATAPSSATNPGRTAVTPTTAVRHHAAHAAHAHTGRPRLLPHSIAATPAPTGLRQRETAAKAATAAAMAAAGKPGSKFCKLNVGGRTILVSCQAEATVLAEERHSEQTARALRRGGRRH